jgi:N-acetyl-anhydromuramyl-L-alanine amidase AmpD
MVNIKKYGKFVGFEKNKKKKQIIICHSYRPAAEYLSSLKFRNNGKYDRIPNYFVSKNGDILNLLPDDTFSNFFGDYNIDKNSITICIENLGWLQKKPLSNQYVNWIGDIYGEEVFHKKWRDKHIWSKYTDGQMTSLIELCKKLTKKFSINNDFIGHNTKVEGIKIFNGIVCRSNYSNNYTDLNPSFDFERLKKEIENERH